MVFSERSLNMASRRPEGAFESLPHEKTLGITRIFGNGWSIEGVPSWRSRYGRPGDSEEAGRECRGI